MTNSHKIEGVRGWLMVLVVVIGVLTPLAQVASAINLVKAESVLEPHFADNWTLYFGLTLAIIGLRILICLFVARELLYRKTVSARRNAIIGIWFALGVLTIVSLAVVGILSPTPFQFSDAVSRIIWSIGICLIATIYLLRSKRAANTYYEVAAIS